MNVSSATSMVNVLAEGRAQREKAAQDRAETKLRDAQSAVATLKQMNSASSSQASEQRKAAAKQKVDQIKARLRMLQMSGSVDPKVLAQLARELKSAVKGYTGAGGSVGDLGATPAPASATASSPDAASAQAYSGDGAEAGANAQNSQNAQTTSAEPDEKTGDGDKEAAANPADPRAETNPYKRMAQEAEVRFAEAARHGEAAKADREFLSDVRNLANRIKSLAKSAAAAKADPAKQRDGVEAEKAAAEALKQVEDAAKDLGAPGISLTV